MFALLHVVVAVRYVLVLPVRPLTQNWFFLRYSPASDRAWALRARALLPLPLLLNVSPAGATQKLNILPSWGIIVCFEQWIGFSTRSSENIQHFPISILCQCMPQPNVTSFNEALYCVTSAALLPSSIRPWTVVRPSYFGLILGVKNVEKSRWALCVTRAPFRRPRACEQSGERAGLLASSPTIAKAMTLLADEEAAPRRSVQLVLFSSVMFV